MNENTDICKKCERYWQDFPLPLDHVVSHCEILDRQGRLKDMDNIVPYPCTECPFDEYVPNKK
jgi:hypothetical protein